MTQEAAPENRSHRVTLMPQGRTVSAQDGESILDVAVRAGIELENACGGCCACSTCHVKVLEGGKDVAAADEREEDMLDMAPGVTVQSRLACCVTVASDLVVEVPLHNRDLVSEGR